MAPQLLRCLLAVLAVPLLDVFSIFVTSVAGLPDEKIYENAPGQDGSEKQGLSVMARVSRVPQIGANRPKRDGAAAPVPQRAQRVADELDDAIPF
jgi:hypothetical protein